jgi:hypothetical protein
MFFVSYSLLNHTLGRWFPRPLEIASEQTQLLLNDLGRTQIPRLRNIAHHIEPLSNKPMNEFLGHAFAAGADAVWILDRNGEAISGGVICDPPPELRDAQTCMVPGVLGKQVRVLLGGIEIWEAGKFNYSAARIPI